MPIHDWTRVKAGIFHDFHFVWIHAIRQALNGGLLPPGYYAMAEQIAGGMGPDVLTLETPALRGAPLPQSPAPEPNDEGGVVLATKPPKVRFHARTEEDIYARKAKAVVVRHISEHQVIAIVELVSPGNKANRAAMTSFARKAQEFLQAGIHLLIVDLFPPTPRDPHGIHRVIWEGHEGSFTLPEDAPLTCVAYMGGPCPEVFLEPVAVGNPLPEMPLFLTTETYVPVPLEATYQAAWEEVPAFWRDVLTTPVSR
jgi:hypothetical protein